MKMHKRIAAIVALTGCWLVPMGASAQAPEDLAKMQQFLSIMTSYFDIIESTYDVNSDAEKAAIFQMQKIQEVYENRGEKARAIGVFQQVLKETDNPTIRNAAYMLLGDALKETGRADEAIKFLQEGLRENINNAK
ncbi:MAG: tetratricopeptide repeat protein [Gammaproteobacteria bacterium]